MKGGKFLKENDAEIAILSNVQQEVLRYACQQRSSHTINHGGLESRDIKNSRINLKSLNIVTSWYIHTYIIIL